MQIQSGHVLRSNTLPSATNISDSIAPLKTAQVLPAIIDVKAIESSDLLRQQGQSGATEVELGNADNADNSSAMQLDARLDAKLEYEQNTQAKQGAISTYLQHEHAAQREAISQMVGIDTYA